MNQKKNDLLKKEIFTAKIKSNFVIEVTLNQPAKITGGNEEFILRGLDDDVILIRNVKPIKGARLGFTKVLEGYSMIFEITTEDKLDFGTIYALEKEHFGSTETILGNVYDTDIFNDLYYYDGDDLGANYSPKNTFFRLWAPTAKEVNVRLFNKSDYYVKNTPEKVHSMIKDVNGTWILDLKGDYKNFYYNYEVSVDNKINIAVDPYAKAVGVNGMHGMIIDLKNTDPEDFREIEKPELKSFLDAIIYEVHTRDFSIDKASGIENKGKFLGFTEKGTVNTSGESTGLDYIKSLGATHIHLLPIFDYKTVDESSERKQYNWGYDPQNYNVPEGSYATDASNGNVRIKEFKELVKTLNENKLRVIMDVVYNHTFTGEFSNLNLIVPNYYYRQDEEGNFTNGSGCGNELASDRPMVKKYIVDSVLYWAKEYRVDGFRFDLMGVHDIDIMNEIREKLNEIDPTIIVYGEGWTGGDTPLPESERAIKKNAKMLNEKIAVFSDDIRDGIKGDVFIAEDKGFISGNFDKAEDVKFGIVAGMPHKDVNIKEVDYSDDFWADEPTQVINYISAHDNLTLWDKLIEANEGKEEEVLLKQNKLGATILFTSQGIPFIQAGEEFARTKNGDSNSYKSSDDINKLDWERRSRYDELVKYYKGLIRLRKTYKAFRINTGSEILTNIKFLNTKEGIIAYELKGSNQYDKFTVIFNANEDDELVLLNHNNFDILVNDEVASDKKIGTISESQIIVKGVSALVLGHTKKSIKEEIKNELNEIKEKVKVVVKPELENIKEEIETNEILENIKEEIESNETLEHLKEDITEKIDNVKDVEKVFETQMKKFKQELDDKAKQEDFNKKVVIASVAFSAGVILSKAFRRKK